MVSISMFPQDSTSSPKQDAGAPEPNALPMEAVDSIEMPLPSSPQSFFLGSLLALAVLAGRLRGKLDHTSRHDRFRIAAHSATRCASS